MFGRVEILATKGGKIYHRIFGRKGLRSVGPLSLEQNVLAFGGEGSPMKLSFAVDDFVESGIEKQVCEPIVLPQNQGSAGIPAALLRMTVKGESREFWVRSSPDFDERPITVRFPNGSYEVAYDMKRHDLDFQIELVDFEVGMDPGTQRPATFTSEILVSEPVPTLKGNPKAAIREMPFTLGAGGAVNDVNKLPYTVSMNEPYHNGYWTFYQSSYQDMENGTFRSIFQVRYDPIWAWGTVYLGCLTVLTGTWLQFYMRAGVFSASARQTAARVMGMGADGSRANSSVEANAPSRNGHSHAAVESTLEDEERL